MKPPMERGTTVITFSTIGLTSMKYPTGLLTILLMNMENSVSNRGGGVTWNVYKKSSFVRLSNISLAYTIPAKIHKNGKYGSLKFYANVVNAAVFSKWDYFDPEYHGADGLSNYYSRSKDL
jgi:hypothetical protein